MPNCPICATQLPDLPRPGRPSTFCGPACRRIAEADLRRCESKLAGVEDLLLDVGLSRSVIPFDSLTREDHLAELNDKRGALLQRITRIIEMKGTSHQID